MATVTEKRISSAVRALESKLLGLYRKYFGPDHGPDEEFWVMDAELDGSLGRNLSKRPIGAMQIRQACQRYSRAFEEACVVQQSRKQNPKSGKAPA